MSRSPHTLQRLPCQIGDYLAHTLALFCRKFLGHSYHIVVNLDGYAHESPPANAPEQHSIPNVAEKEPATPNGVREVRNASFFSCQFESAVLTAGFPSICYPAAIYL